jgi:tetratricopeptide (TPR) repeat protein
MRRYKLFAVLPVVLMLASCNRDPKVQAQRYVDNGNKFFSKGKYKEASIMYRRALQKDARFGEAYYRWGLTDLKLAAFGDAARQFRRAVELQPDNADAAVKLSEIYLMAAPGDQSHSAQMYKEARELIDKILQLDPNSFEGHRLMGQLALENKDPRGAIKEFAIANKIKPNSPEMAMLYFQALAVDRQMPEAEKVARDLIASQKSYGPIYDLLYRQYMRSNRVDDGEQLLKLKVENNPQKAEYVLQLAQHYFSLNRAADMDAAIENLNHEKTFPEGHLLAGDFFFFRVRSWDRAQQQYEAGMKAFPKDKAVYQKRIVELEATTGKSTEANELLATVLKENPKDDGAIAMRAALMLTTGNRDQINMAANDLQGLVTKTPQNHLLRFNLARALVAKGDIEAARLQLEEAIKLRPDFVVAREWLARIYLAKQDWNKALKASDEILALDRNNLRGHLTRSSAFMGMGDQDKAREELALISKAYPDNSEAKLQVAGLALHDKDYKRAEGIFADLYKANPHDNRGLAGFAEALAGEGRMPDAIKEVEKASEKEPQRQDLKLFVAHLDVRNGRYDDAIRIYETLLEKQPKSSTLLRALAETQRRKGDLNGAIDNFRRCSQEAPSDTSCLMLLGLLMEGTGKRDQAKPIYEQILKIRPDDPLALNNLAFAKAEEGVDLDQALTMAQRAVQKAPGNPQIADTLGWIYIKKSLTDDAVRVFRDLVVKEPNNYQFHYHYGMALLQKGDKPSAKRELETALKDNPSRDDKNKIQDLLQKI